MDDYTELLNEARRINKILGQVLLGQKNIRDQMTVCKILLGDYCLKSGGIRQAGEVMINGGSEQIKTA